MLEDLELLRAASALKDMLHAQDYDRARELSEHIALESRKKCLDGKTDDAGVVTG